MLLHKPWVRYDQHSLLLLPFPPLLSESCLGPGFTETIPPQEELLRRVTSAESIRLNPGDELTFNVTVIAQVDIQAGDVLGFRLVEQGDGGRIEHLPLLFKPGPTPGSFTPIVIANFTATSDSTPTETTLELSPGGPPLSDHELVLKIICHSSKLAGLVLSDC